MRSQELASGRAWADFLDARTWPAGATHRGAAAGERATEEELGVGSTITPTPAH